MITKNGAVPIKGGQYKLLSQDQTTLICLLNYIEFGKLPENAVLNPRFSTNLYQNSFDPNPNRVGRHAAVMNSDPTAEN